MAIRIAISLGDYNGVGPEIVLKSLYQIDLQEITPIILGSEKVLNYYLDCSDFSLSFESITSPDKVIPEKINVLDLGKSNLTISPGTITEASGAYSMAAVEKGIELCLSREADALVTAPISKKAVNKAGFEIPGHTEFLAKKSNASRYLMMLVSDRLRVGLVTTHVPIRKVAQNITRSAIIDKLELLDHSLKSDFSIKSPKIAVFGLNPHAGDGGIIGREEIDIITPAIEEGKSSINVEGPFPADGFFGNRLYQHFDGILAMFHDQGLAPFKAISFGSGVNFTAGLPFIRTSPDHGTAFDIAGKNRANPDSFQNAFKLAVELSRNRLQSK